MTPGRRGRAAGSARGAALLLILVLGLGAARWGLDAPVPAPWSPGVTPAESRNGGRSARARVRRFLVGAGPDTLILAAGEVQALLRQRVRSRLPAGVQGVEVSLRDSTALVTVRVRVSELLGGTGSGGAGTAAGLLGDSARIEAELSLGDVEPGTGRAVVHGIRTGRGEIPPLFVSAFLRQLGLPGDPERPDAVRFPLPGRLTELTIRRGRLVAVRGRPAAGRRQEP